MKREEEKHDPRVAVVKGGANLHPPFSKESSRGDSTRANSSESSAGGRFGDKFKLLKSGHNGLCAAKKDIAEEERRRMIDFPPIVSPETRSIVSVSHPHFIIVK